MICKSIRTPLFLSVLMFFACGRGAAELNVEQRAAAVLLNAFETVSGSRMRYWVHRANWLSGMATC